MPPANTKKKTLLGSTYPNVRRYYTKKCNVRKPKFKLSNDMTPTYFSIEFDEKNSYKMPFFSP